MDLEYLKKQYSAVIDEAKKETARFGDQPIPAEDRERITELMSKADEIKASIDMAERLSTADAYLDEPAGTKAAHLGFRPAGPDEGHEDVDEKAWRSFDIAVWTPSGMETREYRFQVPLAVQKKGYDDAFEAYIRKGRAEIGPNDRKALAEAADASGGYLVPEDMQASVLKKIATMATVRQYARVITTSRDSVRWPRIKYTTNNQYTSGVRLTWTGETPAASTSARVTDQVYGEFNIPVNTAIATQLISFDLIMDSAFDVVGTSSELFGEAFALGENSTFWSGNGAGQPRGILTDASDTANFDASITLAATADTFDADEVIDVAYALPAQYERNARWFFTKATEKTLRKLKDADSDYIWVPMAGSGMAAAPDSLLGFPYTRDEFMDNLSDSDNTTTYPLVFGDLSGYVVVDRVGLSIQRFDEIYSETNQALLLGKKRVGGQLVEAYKLSLLSTVNST